MSPNVQNFRRLLNEIGGLSSVVNQLNANHIRYGIYSGSYVYIATGCRLPSDVDILVADADIPKIKQLFASSERVEQSCCLYLYPDNKHQIEIVSRSVVHIGGAQYHFKLTDLAWQHTRAIGGGGCQARLCDSVDTILLKAVLQRSEQQGKHDFSDIEALVATGAIDHTYLRERVREFGFDDRLNKVLQRYHLYEKAVSVPVWS